MISVSEKVWEVGSLSNEIYQIRESNKACTCELRCIDCQACIHAYVCTCSDSCIKWNMCKHIHLCTTIKEQVTPTPQMKEDDEDTNLMIYENPKHEQNAMIKRQLDKQTSSNLSLSLENYKTKIQTKLNSILSNVTNIEQCEVIEKALLSLSPTLLALETMTNQKFEDL